MDKKLGENGNSLKGVTIHKKSTNGEATRTVIKAKTGELISNESSNLLQLVLNDGYYYEDIIPKAYNEQNKMPFAKASFKTDVINIDLNKLDNVDINDESVKNTEFMLNVKELLYTLDSLNKYYKKDVISFTDNIYQRTGVNVGPNRKKFTGKITPEVLKDYDLSQKKMIVSTAINNITSTNFSIDGSKMELDFKKRIINNHLISLFEKFMFAFSCILMFFIGAPLGAIIRKGGLGLPMVFAVLIFIIFHFINTFGKKLAEEDGIAPFLGVWMSTLILIPLAVLLTYRAINDTGLINLDAIFEPIQKFFMKLIPIKKTNK